MAPAVSSAVAPVGASTMAENGASAEINGISSPIAAFKNENDDHATAMLRAPQAVRTGLNWQHKSANDMLPASRDSFHTTRSFDSEFQRRFSVSVSPAPTLLSPPSHTQSS
eukprot:6198580-Pleurochrysis_carterae.AAC.1